MINGGRQPSRDGTSRMTRECQVRICEGLGVKFPGPTRQKRGLALIRSGTQLVRSTPDSGCKLSQNEPPLCAGHSLADQSGPDAAFEPAQSTKK